MRRYLRWAGIGAGSIAAAVVLGLIAIYAASEVRFRHVYNDIVAAPLRVDRTPAAVERGRHLATAIGKCTDCHGPDLGGKVFIDAGPVGVAVASNLTTGRGGVAGRYTDGQLERAIRHGVDADGRGVVAMPSDDYNGMSDQDMRDLIAYVRSVPPVDRELPATKLRTLGRVLYLAGKLPLFPAERIQHHVRPPTPPAPGVTVEYGEYLATIGGCRGCHGRDLAGAAEGEGPGMPPAANLTPRGQLATWSERDFVTALRTGRRPNGSELRAPMPWQLAGQMTDDEMHAVWMYIKSVPPKPTPTK